MCCSGLIEMLLVEAEADHRLSPPIRRQAPEGPLELVDDHDAVALLVQLGREPGTNPPTADHDDVHRHQSSPLRPADTTHLTGRSGAPG